MIHILCYNIALPSHSAVSAGYPKTINGICQFIYADYW